MFLAALFLGIGGSFAAAAVLGGLPSIFTLLGGWPRAAFGIVGAEFLYLAALASRSSKRESGERATDASSHAGIRLNFGLSSKIRGRSVLMEVPVVARHGPK